MAGLACGDNLGDHVRAELHDDAANRLAACRHVEEYLGVGHVAACAGSVGGAGGWWHEGKAHVSTKAALCKK